jgi:hypothetical protein
MNMRSVVKVSLALLLLVCLASAVQAAQLWPLKTGAWWEMDKSDYAGNNWTVRIDVHEEVTLDGKKYFRVVEQNYDPFSGYPDDVYGEFYIRSTNTEVYAWNGEGAGETLAFKTGSVNDSWTYDGGTKEKKIVAIEPVTIPYGGTFTAYVYKHYKLINPDNYDLEWVVPDLGWVKEEDHWVDPARIPIIANLARAGQNPFFKLKSGNRMIYNSSDKLGQTWHLNMEIKGQVTLNGKVYTHISETNYDPPDDVLSDMYIRCTDKEVWKYNGTGEDIVFRAADKGTTWSYPAYNGTVQTTITDIVRVGVPYTGFFVAYVHRSQFIPPFGEPSEFWFDYVVPGEGIIKMYDYWLDNPARAPLIHELAQLIKGGDVTAAFSLLLD